MKSLLIAAVLVLGLGGCATTPTFEVPEGCAPPGYERLDGWDVLGYETGVATFTETGEPITVISVGLSRGDQTLGLVFIEAALILVDPNPLDKSVPLLVNTRYFTADGKLRAEPQGDCGWRELLSGETT